jgi:hypothetical protein
LSTAPSRNHHAVHGLPTRQTAGRMVSAGLGPQTLRTRTGTRGTHKGSPRPVSCPEAPPDTAILSQEDTSGRPQTRHRAAPQGLPPRSHFHSLLHALNQHPGRPPLRRAARNSSSRRVS